MACGAMRYLNGCFFDSFITFDVLINNRPW